MNSNVKEYRSVTRKFSLGYLLLCAVTVGLLLISFLSNAIISKQYKNTTDELLELNELYVDIETINGYVNSSYLYLRADSYDEYFVKCQ